MNMEERRQHRNTRVVKWMSRPTSSVMDRAFDAQSSTFRRWVPRSISPAVILCQNSFSS
jgi:hypothetical protein